MIEANASSDDLAGIRAQAQLHHAYFLGLQLMIATREGPSVMEDWMFRLFRRQHHEKFLSSFSKLGLTELPHAVACAQYHVLANNIGGVGVEYMPQSDRQAWVRFRYPRWMYDGAVICGIPVEVSRGFLRGWYAHNGVSLNNDRLGFVCVSEDMTGEYGLCGYFYEYDQPLAPEQRLQFAKHETPPVFDPTVQPQLPTQKWSDLRLEKANRNYACEYVRNGLCELSSVIGAAEATNYGVLAARLIGMQYFKATADGVSCDDGDVDSALAYLQRMFWGMGDTCEPATQAGVLVHGGLRIIRDLPTAEAELVLTCWEALWHGALQAQQQRKELRTERTATGLSWHVTVT